MKKKQHKATRSEATIADVLHYAADKCLAYDVRCNRHMSNRYSCCAVYDACDALDVRADDVLEGLRNLGCDIGSTTLFDAYGDKHPSVSDFNPAVQGMRYMWLKWAALMAEEQGV